jgi:hypothetical protein
MGQFNKETHLSRRQVRGTSVETKKGVRISAVGVHVDGTRRSRRALKLEALGREDGGEPLSYRLQSGGLRQIKQSCN